MNPQKTMGMQVTKKLPINLSCTEIYRNTPAGSSVGHTSQLRTRSILSHPLEQSSCQFTGEEMVPREGKLCPTQVGGGRVGSRTPGCWSQRVLPVLSMLGKNEMMTEDK